MTPRDDPFLLFVYGTLMRGGVRHFALSGQPFLGPARTAPLYELLDLGAYPGLVRAAGAGRPVEGELYLVERRLLPLLDTVEGAPDLFRLAPVELLGAGEAFAYFYQPDAAGRPRCAADRWDNARSPARADPHGGPP
jgi:gamma-glutamylcyclotransferase (GGCT)/AIG2-like uncharacterized protein YtfP